MLSGAKQVVNSETTIEQNDKQNARCQSLSTWLQDHVYFATVIILIASLVPRLFLTLSADPQDLMTPDSPTYFRPAANLLENGAFLNSKQKPEVTRTPGYSVFLSAIMVVTGRSYPNHEDLRTILVVQSIIISWGTVFLYWLARRILPPVMALTGALFAAFSPWGAVTAGLAMTEGLFLFLLSLLFLLIKLVEDATDVKQALWGSVGVGLLTAAIMLVRPLWPFLPVAAGTFVLRYGLRRKGVGLVLASMLVCATLPVALWVVRNGQEANFYGLSDISGKAAWWCLGSRVLAQANGSDAERWEVRQAIFHDEATLKENFPVQQADDERWRRAKAIFREHPFLTLYSFSRSVAEHLVHPSPETVLAPAKLNFPGDYGVLAVLWGGMVALAWMGWRGTSNHAVSVAGVDRGWLLTILAVCLFLTLLSGVSYGGGSRFRAPLELIVPLLAGVGLVRVGQYFKYTPIAQPDTSK